MLTNGNVSLVAGVTALAVLLVGLEVKADTGFSSVSSSTRSATFAGVPSDDDGAVYDSVFDDTGTGQGSAGSTTSRNTSWGQAMATAGVTPGPGFQSVLSASGLTELTVVRENGFPIPGIASGWLGYEMSSTIVSDTLSIGDPVTLSGEVQLIWQTTANANDFNVTAFVGVEVWRNGGMVAGGGASLDQWFLTSINDSMGSFVDPTGSTECLFTLEDVVKVGDTVKLKFYTFGNLTVGDTAVGSVGFNVQSWVVE